LLIVFIAKELRAVYLRDDSMSPPIMAADGEDIADVGHL
jgi:hypothetical protein